MTAASRFSATSLLASIALALALPLSAIAADPPAAGSPAPSALTRAAQAQGADYRQQQWQRLAHRDDRDSLIAALLIGMSDGQSGGTVRHPLEGQADVERHLARAFGSDPLARYTLALACQTQPSCAQPESYATLVKIAPGNAVHWLVLPHDGAPSDAQLHAAAAAPMADLHLRDVKRIVGNALAGQPAPSIVAGVDAHELAAQLRRDQADQALLPTFAPMMTLCKTANGQRLTDCLALSRKLQDDRGGSILARMIGNVTIERRLKGSAEDKAARATRRDYVWMGEQLDRVPADAAAQERLSDEVIMYGEWEAFGRAVERLGVPRTPPKGWMPKNPQTLLLSEERTPAPAK